VLCAKTPRVVNDSSCVVQWDSESRSEEGRACSMQWGRGACAVERVARGVIVVQSWSMGHTDLV